MPKRALIVELDERDHVVRAYAVFSDRRGDVLGMPWFLELDAAHRASPAKALDDLVVWAWPDTGSDAPY